MLTPKAWQGKQLGHRKFIYSHVEMSDVQGLKLYPLCNGDWIEPVRLTMNMQYSDPCQVPFPHQQNY